MIVQCRKVASLQTGSMRIISKFLPATFKSWDIVPEKKKAIRMCLWKTQNQYRGVKAKVLSLGDHITKQN